ncbi:uncharacterized protein ISCGN_006911 [Ixodes scapularis]
MHPPRQEILSPSLPPSRRARNRPMKACINTGANLSVIGPKALHRDTFVLLWSRGEEFVSVLDNKLTTDKCTSLTISVGSTTPKVFPSVIIRVLLPALAIAFPSVTSECVPTYCGRDTGDCHLSSHCVTARVSTPSIGNYSPDPGQRTPSSSSTDPAMSTIKLRQLPTRLCWLGGCAATQSTNPLAFAMQVSKPYVIYSKK